MPSPDLPELRELNTIRLARDWTWVELSHSMAGAGVIMSPRTLQWLIMGTGATAKHYDRTIYKVRLYLAHMKEMARRQRVRRATLAAKKPIGVVNGREA